ncbi:MAG: four helix bundle protein [Anaerolineales bacterium]|nr:four helix bundle protein [Anaerolineales bacterium]
MAKGDDIQDRLIDFAVSIIHLCAELPKSQAGKHITEQLLRSGTSPAPNYTEARNAESPGDFVHKLKITLKELNETGVWLQVIRRSEMLTPAQLDFVSTECEELSKIINASIKTVLAKKQVRTPNR